MTLIDELSELRLERANAARDSRKNEHVEDVPKGMVMLTELRFNMLIKAIDNVLDED